MKRRDVIREMEARGAVFEREGHEHTIYRNPRTGRLLSVPRHNEIAEWLARDLIKQAGR